MTPEQFTKKAIEGGWKPKNYYRKLKSIVLNDAVLDPDAWRAVGKVEGWSEYQRCKLVTPFYHNEKPGREGIIVGESRDGKQWWVIWDGIKARYSYDKSYIFKKGKKDSWQTIAHAMIDALAEDKSIEDYLKTLD